MKKKNNKKVKIGILGGSFNPPHIGHLAISNEALKRFDLTKVMWIVSKQNPLKSFKNYTYKSFEDRLELAKKLTKNNSRIVISDIERKITSLQNRKSIFTIDLLDRITLLNPEYDIYFIIGADNLYNFHKWYRYRDLLNKYKFIVFDRGDYKYKSLSSRAGSIKKHEYIHNRKTFISSTDIRKKEK